MKGTESGRVRALIYSHGHRDHLFTLDAMSLLDVDPTTRLIAHELVPERMHIFERLSRYHERIRGTQFKEKSLAPFYQSPVVYPTELYRDEKTVEAGGRVFRVMHVKGETDDASMIHIVDMDCIIAGDLLIGSWPNLGNPFKEPRYGYDWIKALKRMKMLEPKVVIPGHGPVLQGKEVQQCLRDTIDGLEFVYEAVISGMNAGSSLRQMVREVHLPQALENSPYLRQIYSRVELAVIAFYRSYAGWWDEDPSSVYPSCGVRVAEEIRLALHEEQYLLNRCEALWEVGDRTTAMELIQFLIRGRKGAPDAQVAEGIRDRFLDQLLDEDKCLMTRAAWIAAKR